MADGSKIEWTEATWNVVTGCEKVSAGCKNCYALRDWPRLASNPKTVYFGREFSEVKCHPERLDQPLRWKRERRIFVNSMSDLFHPAVPDEFIDQVFAVIAIARNHTFQVLTKRAERMQQYMSAPDRLALVRRAATRLNGDIDEAAAVPAWPPSNAELGISVEDQNAANLRVPLLLATPAAVRWISAEPLLGPVSLRWLAAFPENQPHTACHPSGRTNHLDGLRRLDWIVVGGESGPKARPMHPEWVRSLRDQCAEANVPFLFKQWGEWCPRGPESMGYPIDERERIPMVQINTAGENAQLLSSTAGHSATWMQMSGKRFAGRKLDGIVYDAYPR